MYTVSLIIPKPFLGYRTPVHNANPDVWVLFEEEDQSTRTKNIHGLQ